MRGDAGAVFAHRLALRLGMSIADVWAMDVDEWYSWQAFDALESEGGRG
jgi:hypothetical protein